MAADTFILGAKHANRIKKVISVVSLWLAVFTKFSQKISTHILTWLIDGAIYMLYEV